MQKNNLRVTVLGAGNMGTAIANVVAKNGYQVKLWNFEGDIEPLDQIANSGENKKYLPGIKLSKNILPEKNLQAALNNTKVVFFVLPSSVIGSIVKRVSPYLMPQTICVDVSKGLEEDTLTIVPQMIESILPPKLKASIISISGPSIALDMVKGGFTAMNIAGKNKKSINIIKQVMCNENFRLIETDDMIGLEIAGSLKNVYAIAMGICDCLKYSMNTKAAILVMALKEIAELINKMGGKKETAYTLTGMGDLIGTALSVHSRNRRFGEYLPKCQNKNEAAKLVGQVVEGVNASKITLRLAKKYQIKMPLAQTIYDIVWKAKPAEVTFKKYLKNIL